MPAQHNSLDTSNHAKENDFFVVDFIIKNMEKKKSNITKISDKLIYY